MSKCKVDNLTINGIEYVPVDGLVAPVPTESQVKIVILQRGWVMIGYYKRDGDNVSLHRASILRNFGTTKGLGEIAQAGPTSNTKLDPTNGLVEFHRLTEVATISCKDSVWASLLK